MKKQRPVTAMKRRPHAPIIPGALEPLPPTNPEHAADSGPTRLNANANQEDSAKFRAEILRRYDAPFTPAWQHGGLNE
jgi:hypothetical protein